MVSGHWKKNDNEVNLKKRFEFDVCLKWQTACAMLKNALEGIVDLLKTGGQCLVHSKGCSNYAGHNNS